LTNPIDNSKAVAPIIGLALMVAITVIFAAVAVSAFGADPIKKAPQADIRAISEEIGNDAVIKLIHQGGEQLSLSESQTRIFITGDSGIESEVSYANLDAESDQKFGSGNLLFLYIAGGDVCIGNGTLPNADHTDIAHSGETLNVLILDVNSQLMIANIDVRF
ncbi:MAG: type IV pilin N-terminal domain-containing protein, partial [Methanosarcinaceae archaeon]|nr:type IV pilin N-terminal domain-containing protein [Methanosarcinaceae archaeon]